MDTDDRIKELKDKIISLQKDMTSDNDAPTDNNVKKITIRDLEKRWDKEFEGIREKIKTKLPDDINFKKYADILRHTFENHPEMPRYIIYRLLVEYYENNILSIYNGSFRPLIFKG